MAHAIWFPISRERDLDPILESYFEDEQIPELGSSWENAILGGITVETPNYLSQTNIRTNTLVPEYYYIITNYPTLCSLTSLPHDAGVLKYPSLNKKNQFTPVQVSYYENIQREDFWEVGIRSYGLEFLKSSPRGKARMIWEFNVTAFEKDGRVLWSNTKQGNSSLIYDHERDLSSHRQKLSELKTLSSMTPEVRTAIAYGTKILDLSSAKADYEKSARYIRDEVEDLYQAIENPLIPSLHFTNKIDRTSKAHEELIRHLLITEAIADTIYTDRRDYLMTWNRKTRIFVDAVRNSTKNRQDAAISDVLQESRFRLERCRMRLWNPDHSNTKSIEDEAEYSKLEEALNQMATYSPQGIETCESILRNPNKSIYAEAFCNLLIAGQTDPALAAALHMRKLHVMRTVRLAEALLKDCPKEWLEPVRYLARDGGGELLAHIEDEIRRATKSI